MVLDQDKIMTRQGNSKISDVEMRIMLVLFRIKSMMYSWLGRLSKSAYMTEACR